MSTYVIPESSVAAGSAAGAAGAVATGAAECTAAAASGAAAAVGAGAGGGGGGGVVPPHRLVGFAHEVEEALVGLGGVPAWSMTPAEQAEVLVVLDRVSSRMAELELRVLAAADRDQVGSEAGATSTAAWLAHATRQTRARCGAAVRLAEALDERYEATRRALAAGVVNTDQARVIAQAVDALTREHDDLPDDIHERAQAHLLDLAEQFDAVVLRRLGKRLFEVVCPEAADAAEGEALEAEEERARRKASLSMRDNGDGTVSGWFRLPVLHAALLKKALEALTSPRRVGDGRLDPATGKKLPYQVLLGQGFTELLEHHLNPAGLPSQGGCPFTLVVTIGIDALRTGIGAGTLETGERISAGAVRRLACRAGLIPMVLDGESVPLDLGREQRLFDRYQRLALAQTYGGCATEGCDRPPSWTDTHHKHPWQHGGRTDLADGLPLCPPHHQMADHPQQ
ncbi:HNH endonuclease signature motif containing protein [Nocardioides pakistanensis]